jgi:hypothetical protein
MAATAGLELIDIVNVRDFVNETASLVQRETLVAAKIVDAKVRCDAEQQTSAHIVA